MFFFEAKVTSKSIVIAETSVLIGSAFLKIFMIQKSTDLIFFAWVIIFETVVCLILYFLILNTQGIPLRYIKLKWKYLYRLLLRSWPLLLSATAMVLNSKIDQLMVGHLMGNFYVGLYSAASRLSDVWYFFPAAVVASVFPTIIRWKEEDKKKYNRMMTRLYMTLIFVTTVLGLVVSIVGDTIVVFLYGEIYSDAGQVLVIHIWTSIFVAISHANQRWLLNENLEKKIFVFLAIGVVLNVILNSLLYI